MTKECIEDKPKPFVEPVFEVDEAVIPGNFSVLAMADAEHDKEFVRKMERDRRK